MRKMLIKTLAMSLHKDITGIVVEHFLGDMLDSSSTYSHSEDKEESDDEEMAVEIMEDKAIFLLNIKLKRYVLVRIDSAGTR